MPDSLIPYDDIVQEALRAVVGRVLGGINSNEDLPGGHHFYITFKTSAPGVVIPKQLMQRFPDEMTVVLQNKFWDLTVDEEGFEVGLTFSQVPTKLFVPFAAITAFVDPAVLADPAIYPDAETQSRLWAPKALNEEQERALTRIFQDIKSG